MPLTRSERKEKLRTLAECEGYENVHELLEAAVHDSVVPSICTIPGCDYTTGMEPDQNRGYCEACGKQTVQSCLVLAGII